MQHIIWFGAGTAEAQTRQLLSTCGLDVHTTHRGVREALDMWFRGEIAPDYISDILYVMNMVSSDYGPYLECIKQGLLHSLGTQL